jgi:hypothetical protein
MRFEPRPNETVQLGEQAYIVLPHPRAKGLAFRSEASRATVFGLKRQTNGHRYALKVFKPRFRTPTLVGSVERLSSLANLPGMRAAKRVAIEPTDPLAQKHQDLAYSMLMPWIDGVTWFDLLARASRDGFTFDPQLACRLCDRFLAVIEGLEVFGAAHTDIAPGNVVLRFGREKEEVQLIDLEDIYVPQSDPPEIVGGGTPGYDHPLQEPTWCPEGDRYAAAIFAAEILLLSDSTIAGEASDTGLFAGNRDTKEGQERFNHSYSYLLSLSPAFAAMFETAWLSANLASCPTLTELRATLQPAEAGRTLAIPGVRWRDAIDATEPHEVPVEERSSHPIPAKSKQREKRVEAEPANVPGMAWSTAHASPSKSSYLDDDVLARRTALQPVAASGPLLLFVLMVTVVNPLIAVALSFGPYAVLADISFNVALAILTNAYVTFSVFVGVYLWLATVRAVLLAKWSLAATAVYPLAWLLMVNRIAASDVVLHGILIQQGFAYLVGATVYASVGYFYLGRSMGVFGTSMGRTETN